MEHELRIVGEGELLSLPIVKRGELAVLTAWARGEGYEWVRDSQLLFGGYWRGKKDCLYIT